MIIRVKTKFPRIGHVIIIKDKLTGNYMIIRVKTKKTNNMKKTYIIPTLNVVRIETQHILSGSTQSVEFGSGTKAGSEACGRGSDDWDDED